MFIFSELFNTPFFNDANLVSLYRMETLTTDSKGANTLTNNNTVGQAAGLFGNCADFGTSNTNKSLTKSTNMGFTSSTNITMSLWVKNRTEISANAYVFNALYMTTNHVGYAIFYEYNGGTRRIGFNRQFSGTGAGGDSLYLVGAMGTTNWYQLGLTWDGTTLSSYVNGIFNTSVTSTSLGTGTLVDGYAIGDNTDAFGSFSSSFIDDVSLFSRALSATEMLKLYAIQSPLYMTKQQAVNRGSTY